MCQSPLELDAKLPPHPDTKKHVTMATSALNTMFLLCCLFLCHFFFLKVSEWPIKCVGKYSQTELLMMSN